MPAVQFRDPSDTLVTVSDSQGNVLFIADVLEINSLLAASQKEAGGTAGGQWLRLMGLSLQKSFNLAEPPTPSNCDKLAHLVVDTLKKLKNEAGSTPTS